jgi:glycosyltransferase A (GT-A) superfamily protein (DUF2064 family)
MKPLRILVFAKAPLPGRVKTRLIPALGAEGAARLARHLLGLALARARVAAVGPVELCMSPAPGQPRLGVHPRCRPDIANPRPGRGRPGPNAWPAPPRRCTSTGGEAALLTGTDCPGLDAARLGDKPPPGWQDHDAVLHPAEDGGYPLLGLNAFAPELFADMPWSTPAVARLTLERMAALGWRVWIGGDAAGTSTSQPTWLTYRNGSAKLP